MHQGCSKQSTSHTRPKRVFNFKIGFRRCYQSTSRNKQVINLIKNRFNKGGVLIMILSILTYVLVIHLRY